jgi:hypothetical protein
VARIVSGLQDQDGSDFGAVLRGFRSGQESRLREEQGQREQAELMLRIQKAALEHREEEAKSQALLNQQAQMGSAQAIKQLALRMQYGANPDARVLRDAIGTVNKITDPKAKKVALEAMGIGLKSRQAKRQRQAMEGMLADATRDKDLFSPKMVQNWQQRAQTGEPPQNIAQEIMKERTRRASERANAEANAEDLQKAQELVKAAPRGFGRKQAEIALNMAMDSEAAMSKPDAGAKVLAAVQKALLGTRAGFEEQEEARRQRMQEILSPGSKAPGLGGMTTGERSEELENEPHAPFAFGLFGEDVGTGGPDIPPFEPSGPRAHKTVKAGKKITAKAGKKAPAARLLPEAQIREAESEEEVLQAMRNADMPVNAQTITAAMELWRSRGE